MRDKMYRLSTGNACYRTTPAIYLREGDVAMAMFWS